MSTPTRTEPFEHIGMLYRTVEEYTAGTVAFIDRGLAAGDPVMVAVPADRGERIRAALGDRADRVGFTDMTVAGRNPGRIIPGVLLAFATAHPGRRAWLIGEPIWAGRSDLEYPACVVHEALINEAFAGRDAAILCPYDATALTATVIADSYRTHPVMADARGSWSSAEYLDPRGLAAVFNRRLPAPPPDARRRDFAHSTDLAAVRALVARHAEAAGMPVDRVTALLVAVNELATNTIEHSGGAGVLSVWTERGTLVCQVDDTGGPLDPMLGRIPAGEDSDRGRGLLIVNELVDLVRVYTAPGATSIRIYVDLAGTPADRATGTPDATADTPVA